jgi:hypothetical protein
MLIYEAELGRLNDKYSNYFIFTNKWAYYIQPYPYAKMIHKQTAYKQIKNNIHIKK